MSLQRQEQCSVICWLLQVAAIFIYFTLMEALTELSPLRDVGKYSGRSQFIKTLQKTSKYAC